MPMIGTDIGPSQIVTATAHKGRTGISGNAVNVTSGQSGSRGLGDTIAKATRAVGIKPCGGCKNRQKDYNERFPYDGRLARFFSKKGKR